MILFMSSDRNKITRPEIVLGDEATIMCSFYVSHQVLKKSGELDKRFQAVLEARQNKAKKRTKGK